LSWRADCGLPAEGEKMESGRWSRENPDVLP